MAKKRNRRTSKSAATTRKPSSVEVEDSSVAESSKSSSRPSKATATTRQEAAVAQLEQEYGYVAKDLRRVFILALAMFALLIALNLFLS